MIDFDSESECLPTNFMLSTISDEDYSNTVYSVCGDEYAWITVGLPDDLEQEGPAQITCFSWDDCIEDGDTYPCDDTKGFRLVVENVEVDDGVFELEFTSFEFVKTVDDKGNYQTDLEYDFGDWVATDFSTEDF